ncbi:MAG: 30S ribosome-binding factor RbfA [Candidatus Omnitrophota bacterium]
MGRMERINEMMKRELGKIISQELFDPRLQFVSVTFVRVSPDLHNAVVGFSFLGDKKQVDTVQQTLKHAAGLVRKMISQRVEIRHTPRFDFVYDPSLEYSANIEQVLEEIKREIPFEKGEDIEEDEEEKDYGLEEKEGDEDED